MANLKRQISDNRRFVDEFDRTALAYLLKADMHPAELEKAFHILHPDTLKLIVGDHIEVRSPKELIDRIRAIAAAVQQGVYQDAVVRVRLDALRGPDIRNSRVDVAAGLLLDEQRLRESEERLRVADGLELAKDDLKKKQEDLTARLRGLG